MDSKMLKELNQQIQEETYSSYIYLAMAADLEANGFKGMATWMQVQAREEKIHADIFLNYILERGERVELEAIQKPPVTWESPLAIFQAALDHEKHITGRIDHMVKVARELNDNASLNMLQWFIEEQVEEEANVGEAVQQLEIVGDDGRGKLMIDREMGTRVFSVPASAPYYPKPGQAIGA
ncbi:MAG: ferritin [Candidatus Bathyarchaeota archaeon]|nr:ferritin [Candidatus Bathyarchaeota archaeon]